MGKTSGVRRFTGFKLLPNHQISIKKDEANDYERRRIRRAGHRAGDPWLTAVEHGDA